MNNFIPYYTNDGSVGLYSDEDNDIYHSTYGALSEAYEKFFIPSDFLNNEQEDIKILDICYGIGYNSKTIINEKIKNYFNNTYIEQIHTDNILQSFLNKFASENKKYIDKIYSDNISGGLNQKKATLKNKNLNSYNLNNKTIEIDAVDTNLLLLKLSPFIKANFTTPNYFAFLNETRKINKFVKNNIKINKLSNLSYKKIKNAPYYISSLTNVYLAIKLIDATYTDSKEKQNKFFDVQLNEILNNKKYLPFFDKNIISLAKKYEFWGYKHKETGNKSSFLHNIYYRYISLRYKSLFLALSSLPLNIDFFCADAREVLKHTNKTYNIVYLDAFTPSKCPCLWTVDFFKEIYNHLSEDGLILTYSTSAAIRGAMKEAGFYVGKTISQNSNNVIGTVASKSETKIKNNLDEFEFGLLNTKAGIPYRDKSLSLNNTEIYSNRKLEVEQSSLISTSQYKKGKKC